MNTGVKFTLGAVLFFIVIIIVNLLIGNNAGGSVFPNYNQPSLSAASSPIKIFSSYMDKDADGNLFILGVAQNIGNAELNYSEIDANFYDKAGNLMTKSFDKIKGLSANETWNFKIMYNGVTSYDVGSYNLSVGNYW
jgi:hypothetical protein